MTPPRLLLDTNICIYIRRQRPPQVLARFEALEAGAMAISVITWGELIFGAEKSQRRAEAVRALEEFSASIRILGMTARTGKAYGAIRAELERTGQTIGNNDLWIAAHAQAENLTLVTNNEREFSRIPDLHVENWAK